MIFDFLFIFSPLGIRGYLWIIALFFVFVWWILAREKAGHPFPNALMKKYSHTPLLLTCIWSIRAIIIFVLALSILHILIPTPRENKSPTEAPRKETVITLDISKSMETDDILPSRIEFAKNILHDRTLTLGHLGFIIFAGKTFVLSPITTDTKGLNYLVETLQTDTINQSEAETSGTNIGDALIQASTLFTPETPEKNIILITDGRANIGLDPIIASESIKAKNIKVSVIALGSATGSLLTHLVDGKREPLLDGSGNTINGSVDIPSLSRIASITSGKLVHISKGDATSELEDILGGEIPTIRDTSHSIPSEKTIAFLIAGLAFMHLVLSIIFWRRYKTS